MSYLGTFGLEFGRIIFIFEIAPSNLTNCKISPKKQQKCLNLGPKMPYLGIFGLKFEENIIIFEISTLEFVEIQNFAKKEKCLNLGP